jgi:chloramphenicol-sensitive protein RarD
VRKHAPVAPLPGLTIEAAVLLLPAIAIIAWQAQIHGAAGVGSEPGITALVALSGLITATPLLLFASAAKRMSFSALGFVQFLSPTIAFLLALFVFHEPLSQTQLLSFVAIWGAVGLFSWDMWQRRGLIRAG